VFFSKEGYRRIKVYTDADWVGCLDNRKSTSDYCAFVGGNMIFWRNKKQNVMVRSTTEAEYRAMTHNVSEGLWQCVNASRICRIGSR
jgi:hypothetical protein